MARLFGKDYHEYSNTWYFRHALIPMEKGDLLYWKSLDDEKRVRFHFFPVQEKRHLFTQALDLIYDPVTGRIISHTCSDCREEETCRHFLSVLYYAYRYLNTEMLSETIVETYDTNILRSGEEWMAKLAEAVWEVEGIYNPETDKIRFYYHRFVPLDMRLAALLLSGRDCSGEDERLCENIRRNIGGLSDAGQRFLIYLVTKRCALSQKGKYFSIYKSHFAPLLNIIKQMGDKFAVRETGELLSFAEHPMQLSIRIEELGKDTYSVRPVIVDELSVWFCGQPVWLFFRSEVRQLHLPFLDEVTDKLLGGNLTIQTKDLVYYRTIVWRQLNRLGHYLDIAAGIELPIIYDNRPSVHFLFHRQDSDILLEGTLRYSPEVEIPISVLRFRSPLVCYELEGSPAWFYIPPHVFSQIRSFLQQLPAADYDRLEQFSQLVFRGKENINALKKAVYELSVADWDIDIDEELKKDFIYKVPLFASINAGISEEINWFSYEVKYNYKDFSFTHEELRRFFKSGEEFLKTKDGRLVFLTQREVFEEIESLLRKSELVRDKVYRARVNLLPYYWRLKEENPALVLQGDVYLQTMFTALLQRRTETEEHLPAYLQTVLRSYQKAGYAWLRMLMKYHLHGILADEMGLGKTIQALSVLAEAPPDSVSLVICPKTLLYNWAAEIEKFHTNIPHCVYEGNRAERLQLLQNPNVRLFIISYSLVSNDIAQLAKMKFKWIVLDEAQQIKNITAQRTHAIKKLNADYRLCLSGTPIENDLTELWSIMDFLMPGYLGNYKRFRKEFAIETPSAENRKRLNRAVAPFILRRIKRDVLFELPDKQEQISWCKFSPVQEKTYLQILDTVKKNLFPSGFARPAAVNYIHVLAALTKLRQVCDHPALVNPDLKAEMQLSAKTEQLMELVEESLQSRHKVLVFSQFVEMLQLVRPFFDAAGIVYEYMDGRTKDRISKVNRFNKDPLVKVFLISLKTGGMGLNLTAADTVILLDPWWNPMIENQAIDRAHRIGQTKKVQVFRLICKGTVEEKIISLQKSKLELFADVIEDGQSVLKSMNSEELKELFLYHK